MLVAGCLIIGGLIGFTGGVLGIGGGLLAIPLLAVFLGMDQQMAQGTALIMVIPAVLIALRHYNRHARLDLQAVAIGGATSLYFTWLGAGLALGLDPTLLRRIYAVFILCIALYYFYQNIRPRPARPGASVLSDKKPHRMWFVALGALAGIVGGIFGIGGSILVVPLLTAGLRYTQTGAQGLAMSMVLPSSAVALATYSWHGQVDWLVGVPLAFGSVFMVPYGVKLAHSLPEPRLKMIFAYMLLVIMMMLLYKA